EGEASSTDFHNVKFASVPDLIENSEIERTGDRIKVNLEAQEFIRRVMEESDIRAGKKKLGDDSIETSFSGLFQDREQTGKLISTLKGLASDVKESSEAATFVNKLVADIEAAKEAGGGTVVAYMYDKRLPHELFHQASYLGDMTGNLNARHADAKTLDTHGAVKTAYDTYFSKIREYRDMPAATRRAVIREEVAAYIAGGETELLGINENEAVDYLVKWFYSYTAKNGVESLNKFAEIEGVTYDVIEQIKQRGTNEQNKQTERIESNDTAGEIGRDDGSGESVSGESEQNARGESRSDEAASGASQTGTRSVSGERAESARTERVAENQERRTRTDGGRSEQSATEIKQRKKAAFSRILGEDISYDPQSHEATEQLAAELENTKGVAAAVNDALTSDTPSAESMRVVYRELARQNALADEHLAAGRQAEYDAVSGEIAKLSNQIVSRQLGLGRAVEIAKTLAPISPEHTLLVAAKMKQTATGDDSAELTVKETAAVRETAKENSDSAKQLSRADSQIEKLKQKIKDLQAGTRVLQPRKIGEAKPRVLSQIEKKTAADLNRDFEKYAGEAKGLFDVATDALKRIEDDPTLKRAEGGELTDRQREALTAIGAKLLFDGLKNRADYGVKAFTKELTNLAGEDVAPFADEIHAAALDKIAEVKKAATRTRLANRFLAAEPELTDASAHAKADAEIAGRKAANKEKAALFGEHRKAKNAFNANKELTENIAAYDESAETVYAGILLKTTENPTFNQVIGDIAKEFDLHINEAKAYAQKAQTILKQIKIDTERQKMEASKQTAEEITEARELRRRRLQAGMKLRKLLGDISKPQNLIKRANNLYRGALVANPATQIFNAVQAITGAIPQEVFTDIADTAVRRVGRQLGITNTLDEIAPETRFRDAANVFGYILGNQKQLAEDILTHFPDEAFRMLTGLMPDVDLDSSAIEQGANKVSKIVHKGLDKADAVIKKLATFSGAELQEAHFRTAVFTASLANQLRVSKVELKDILAKNEAGNINPKIIEAAVDKALRVTFAERMDDDALGKHLKQIYNFTDNYVPVLLNPVVYARFTYTITKSVINAHTFGMLDSKTFGGKGYNSRSFAKGLYGMAAIALSYGLLGLFNNDDEKWYQWRLAGKDNSPIDIRRFFPVSGYAFTANLIKSKIEGRPLPPFSEFIEGFASLDLDQYGRSAGLTEIKAVYNTIAGNDIDALDNLGVSSARFAGNTLSGVLRFFKPFRDIYATIDEEEAKYRDYGDSALGAFGEEISRNIPTGRLWNAPVKQNPVTGEDVKQIFPAGRVIGLNFTNPMFTRPKPTVAEQNARQLFPSTYTGDGSIMSSAERETYAIKRELKEAVRRGDLSTADAKKRIAGFVAQGKLSADAAKLLNKNLAMTDLQEIINRAYTPGDKKDVKKLEWLKNKMTDQEKTDVNEIVSEKNKQAKKKADKEVNPKNLAEQVKHASTDKTVELYESYENSLTDVQKKQFMFQLRSKAMNAAKRGTLTDDERE
ncbi:MAG: hypothetical protein ACR2L1_00895, partial [Pyrinomonadaceae bacterium]